MSGQELLGTVLLALAWTGMLYCQSCRLLAKQQAGERIRSSRRDVGESCVLRLFHVTE